jgi:hypothetical protein
VAISTIDNISPGTIVDLNSAPGESDGEIVINWTSSGDDVYSGIAESYQIYVSDDTITVDNWQTIPVWPNPPAPLTAGQLQEFTISGLNPAEEYWIAITVVDDASNCSELSNIVVDTAKYEIVVDAEDEADMLPYEFNLAQNYPNPFNPTTRIEFSLASEGFVNLTVYNVLGQSVATLVDETMSSGLHTVVWNGTNDSHQPVSSGHYFYVLSTEENTDKKKMVLLK